MTQKEVAGYRKLCREIEITKDKIADLYSTDPLPGTVKGSHPSPPYLAHTIPVGLQKSPQKLESQIKKLARLEEQRRNIEQYVDGIADDEVRQIIEIYYMVGNRRPSLQAVAMRMGWQAESTPRRKIENFFACAENAELGVLKS